MYSVVVVLYLVRTYLPLYLVALLRGLGGEDGVEEWEVGSSIVCYGLG